MDTRLLIFLMELASSVISFIVGYFALRAYKTTGSKGPLLLYLGFLILGIGIFLRFVTATYVGIILRVYPTLEHPRLTGLVNLAALIYMGTQLIAYGLFTATYVLQATHSSAHTAEAGMVAAAAVPLVFRLFFIPQLELIAITLLGFITVYTCTNWLLKRGSGAALVFLGFGLMLLSHLFFLLIVMEDFVFLVLGQTTQLAGFICLLTMLAKVSKTNA